MKRIARRAYRIAAIGAGVVIAAAFASAANARLVYQRGFRTSHPTIWVARDDGTGAHRLAFGGAPEVSPDGRLVAYVGGRGLMLVRSAGGHTRLLLHGAGPVGWSPDGKWIAAVEQTRIGPEAQAFTFVTIDVVSGRVHTVAPAGVPEQWAMSFSPDGNRLAYSGMASANTSRYDIYRAPATGQHSVRLTRGGQSMWPVWGPSWIVFIRQSAPSPVDHIPKQSLYLVKPSGAGLHRLTNMSIGDQMFGFTPIAWSANGHRLIAEFNGINTDYVVTVDPRTGAVRRVGKPTGGTAGEGISGDALSRDGTTILGVRGSSTAMPSVVTLPYQGGRPRVLARNAISPSWSR